MKLNITGLVALIAWVAFSLGCDTPSTSVSSGHQTVEITEANFEQLVLNNEQPVLLDFWADWCGPCLQLGPTIESLAADYDGKVLIGKVNVDQQQRIAQAFEINSIPALLYFKNGVLVNRQIGELQQHKIAAAIDEMLR